MVQRAYTETDAKIRKYHSGDLFCSMFTGIVEASGVVESVEHQGTNRTFWISSPLSPELKVDQSVSHDGVCLTVEEISGDQHRVTAVEETLKKTNLGSWQAGSTINLERCMQMNGRLDGHLVQGHVDTTARCVSVADLDGSWQFRFEFDSRFATFIIEKGSISINGTSLTLFDIGVNQFTVAIIPYTYHNTNFNRLAAGASVNIEFDMIGKYVNRMQQLSASNSRNGGTKA